MIPTRSIRHMFVAICVLSLVFSIQISAQQTATKRALTHDDYDGWHSIQAQRLSDDGKFLAYLLVPQDGDSRFIVQNLASGAEWRHVAGNRRAPSTDDDPEAGGPPAGGPGGGGGQGPVFTADSSMVVFQIHPTVAELEQARKEKKKPAEMPKNAIGIMNLATGQVTRIDRVRNFQVPADASGFVAYSMEPKPGEEAPAADAETNGSGSNDSSSTRRQYGTDLVLRSLTSNTERTFADVLEYTFSRDARSLVYAVASRKEETNGVYALNTGAGAAPSALMAGKGKYVRLSWDEKQTQLAFLSDRDPAASRSSFKLYDWDRASGKTMELVSPATPSFKPGWVISDRGNISFSSDGSRIFFGVAPAPEPAPSADEQVPADEKVVVDLWHWNDDFIQPMQKVRASQERNRSYRAVYHKAEKKFVQLADPEMPGLNVTPDGRWGLGTDDRQYRRLVGVDSNYSDYYIVDTAAGSRKALVQKLSGNVSISPGGRYAAFYRDKHWNIATIPDGKITNLTKNIDVNFWNEEHDSPSDMPSFGNAGWTTDDKYLLLYDRYDIWQVPTDGTAPKNLTNGVGRKDRTVFRYLRLERQEPGSDRGIDPTQPILLSAVNEVTRDEGFYRDRIDGGLPEKLVMAAKNFTAPAKAANADVLVLTASTFNEFPDVSITNSNFPNLKKVTNANPQKANLLWGTFRTDRLQEHRRRSAERHSDEAGKLRSRQEVSDDGLHLREALAEPAPLRQSVAGRLHQRFVST